jgi:hypothetical protein
MEGINTENPTNFDMRLISLKNYYVSLKKKKDIKKLRRLKLLLYMYPKILEKNNFRSIQVIVENPLDRTLAIREKEHVTALECKLASKLYNGTFNPDCHRVIFRVSDFYDYFGVGD